MRFYNREILSKVNYWLIGLLIFFSALLVIFYVNPEKMIEGDWQEVGWYFEKPDHQIEDRGELSDMLKYNIKNEILSGLEVIHVDKWSFQKDGVLTVSDNRDESKMSWAIKGRGHILELTRNGIPVESFQIQQIGADRMELHLNLDLQVRGVIKIILEREKKEVAYAEEI